jgi:hypothetical protein
MFVRYANEDFLAGNDLLEGDIEDYSVVVRDVRASAGGVEVEELVDSKVQTEYDVAQKEVDYGKKGEGEEVVDDAKLGVELVMEPHGEDGVAEQDMRAGESYVAIVTFGVGSSVACGWDDIENEAEMVIVGKANWTVVELVVGQVDSTVVGKEWWAGEVMQSELLRISEAPKDEEGSGQMRLGFADSSQQVIDSVMEKRKQLWTDWVEFQGNSVDGLVVEELGLFDFGIFQN